MSQLSIAQKSVFKTSDAKEQRTQPYYIYKTSPPQNTTPQHVRIHGFPYLALRTASVLKVYQTQN